MFVGNMQQVGPGSAPVSGPAPIRPTLLTTPAGQMHLQNLTSSGSTGADAPKDAFGEFNLLNKKKQPDREAPSSMPVTNAMHSSNAVLNGQDNSANKVCARTLCWTCQSLRQSGSCFLKSILDYNFFFLGYLTYWWKSTALYFAFVDL